MFRKALVIGLLLGGAAMVPDAWRVDAQKGPALTGMVSSPKEGRMEGVLVTARREGAGFDVTVVSNEKGVYSFPSTHLVAGKYSVRIRATGYDLATPNPTVDVPAGRSATLDLALETAKDLTTQLNTVEWLMSIPGTDEQKALVQKTIMSCSYCHSLERVIKSRHNAEQMVKVIDRMSSYYPDGSMAGTEGRGRAIMQGKDVQDAVAKNPIWGYGPFVKKTDIADYLASVNQSGGRALPANLKTLPRPKGKATRVIITQYDMPRKSTVPHDLAVDSKGSPWYNDQSDYFVGTMNPKTGEFREYPLPRDEHHAFGGASDIAVDRDGYVWTPVTNHLTPKSHWGFPGRLDPKTGEFKFIEKPDFYQSTQFMTLAPDGSIFNGVYKIDPKTMKIVDRFDQWQGAANAPPGPHGVYDHAIDSKGNWYGLDYLGGYVVRVAATTKAVSWFKTPTGFSQPRRGTLDAQDRYWFGEYTGDNVGMFDTRMEKFEEYPLGKWTGPYTSSVPDAAGRVYSTSGASDRVYRVDPKTREVVSYLMPTRDFDSKEPVVDPVTQRAVWMSNVRNARLIKLEPLD